MLFRLVWVSGLSFVLSACSGNDADADAPETSATSSPDDSGGDGDGGGDDADGDAGDGDTTGMPSGATVEGWAVYPGGEPVPDLSVSLCGDVCIIDKTDADGHFFFEGISAGVKVIEPAVVPPGDDFALAVRTWTRFFDFVDVEADAEIVIEEPFVLRQVDDALGPLSGPQTLALLPELSVSFDADAIVEHGPLPAGADSVWMGAIAIPEQDWPTLGLQDWTIVGAWGLVIWDIEAPDAFAVTATLPTALDPAAEVAWLVADYDYGFAEGLFWEESAVLSPDGTTLSTPSDGGLDRATRWFAVTRNP